MTTCWRSECRAGCYYPLGCTEPFANRPQTVAQPTGGTTPPPAPARAAAGRFDWPCDRRDAHGRHNVGNNEAITEEQRSALIWSGDWPHCPGVKAHPTTMIGGGYDE